MQQRLIFHVDVNSAFLSWEAARRVAAGEPDLRAISSAIGGGSGESFLSKNKGKGLDAKLARATKWTGAAFLILTFVLNLL